MPSFSVETIPVTNGLQQLFSNWTIDRTNLVVHLYRFADVIVKQERSDRGTEWRRSF